jgi:hypothetical protein
MWCRRPICVPIGSIVHNAFHAWVKANRSSPLGFVPEPPEPDSAKDERIRWGRPQAHAETLLLRDIDHARVARLMQHLPLAHRRCC